MGGASFPVRKYEIRRKWGYGKPRNVPEEPDDAVVSFGGGAGGTLSSVSSRTASTVDSRFAFEVVLLAAIVASELFLLIDGYSFSMLTSSGVVSPVPPPSDEISWEVRERRSGVEEDEVRGDVAEASNTREVVRDACDAEDVRGAVGAGASGGEMNQGCVRMLAIQGRFEGSDCRILDSRLRASGEEHDMS